MYNGEEIKAEILCKNSAIGVLIDRFGTDEHQYRQAFAEAAKVADPTWRAGKPIPAGALDGITRESVESGRKSVDIKV